MEKFTPDFELMYANDFIKTALDCGAYLPKTKLQKLLYFLYGHYLAKYGEELFEEKFQAWQYGPVLPRVYNRTYKTDNVSDYLTDKDGKKYITGRNNENNKKYFSVFNYVWDKYGKMSASELTALSHAPGSPWAIAINTNGPCSEIDPGMIQKYFSGESLING